MTPHEKQIAWIEQAKLAHAAFADRAGREWKVTLGLWALMVAAVARHVHLHWALWTAIVAIYGVFWLRPISATNKDDKLLRDHYSRAADSIVRDPHFVIQSRPARLKGIKRHLFWLTDWSILFQFITTAVLATIAAFLTHYPCPKFR
jgi:hypothetical protein